MASSFSTDFELRVNDPVITSVVQGYSNSEGIAGFVAPIVNVQTRAGKVITFGKEHFAVMDLGRSPGGRIKRIGPSFGVSNYYIRQYAVGSEVPREVYEEAMSNAARIDLRTQAALRTAATLEQAWESQVVAKCWDASAYETSNVIAVGGPVTDFDSLIQDAQELIRAQIGRYANSAIIGSGVSRAIRRSATYRDRIKYTSAGSINTDMISGWWDLSRGVKVAKRQKLVDGMLVDMVNPNSILLFYNPENATSDGFMPAAQSSASDAAFAYTYQLEGYPMAEQERFDEDNKTYVTDLIAEQDINLVGMGVNGKVGAAVLITGITF